MASQALAGSGAAGNGHIESSAPELLTEDDRSSSLSEIEDELDKVEPHEQQSRTGPLQESEVDSEAETERLEQSPHTPSKTNKLSAIGAFEKSPSKLAQAMSAEDDKTAEEGPYSDSEMSSPLASLEEPLDEELEEQESNSDASEAEDEATAPISGKKRKRAESEGSANQSDSAQRPVRRRTGSVKEENPSAPPTDEESAAEEPEPMDVSRESTAEPVLSLERDEPEIDADEEEPEDEKLTAKAEANKTRATRSAGPSQPPNAEDEEEVAEAGEDDEEGDVAEDAENGSDEENDEIVDEEIDEAEAERKNEEEFAKKMVAMESLAELEKQFAILRDKLYDERIGAINRELMQLNGSEPSNAEYLEKMRYVLQHRDVKHEYEHKLLAYKIQALKTKSVAERAQIHSAYYQTIRDIRETHLDQVNELFYKIQRDRFKPDENMTEYTIPFPERRSQQISQQASYNREVSILAGLAKYVGFPAAPEILAARPQDIEDDLEKMGVPVESVPIVAPPNNDAFLSKSTVTAEEQFLEETPWANPKHPVHSRINRQLSDQHDANSLFATPANQKMVIDSSAATGSASTIPENLSAQASSALNTPYDKETVNPSSDRIASRFEQGVAGNGRPGEGFLWKASLSPTETRKVSSVTQHRSEKTKPGEDAVSTASASAQGRANLYSSPLRPDSMPRPQSTQNESTRQGDSSPLASMHTQPGITAGSGYNRFGAR